MIAGALEIQLMADVARLQTDMNKATSIMGAAAAKMEAQAAAVKSALSGMFAGLGVAAMAGFIKSTIEGAAKLHDLAIQSGMTVESLSGLASVGKLSGQGADAIAAASNKLSKNLATTTEEGKGAAAAVKALGIDFATFQKMTPDQRMQAVAVAMSQFADGGQKSAAAMLLFGKTGAELLPFLKDLAEQGSLHAKVTTEQSAAADQFSDNLVRLKAQSESWKKSLAMELLPTLNDILDAMLAMRSEGNKPGTSLLGQTLIVLFQTVAVLSGNVVYILKQLGDGVGGVVAAFVSFVREGPEGFATVVRAMREEAKSARKEVDALSSSLLGILNSKAGAGRSDSSIFKDPRILGPIPAKPELTGLGGPGKDPADGEKQYQKLIKSIKEKIAADEEELRLKRALTEAEKFAVKTRADLQELMKQFPGLSAKEVEALLAKLKALDEEKKKQLELRKLLEDGAKFREQQDKEVGEDEARRQDERTRVILSYREQAQALEDEARMLELERTLIGASDAQRSIAIGNLRIQLQVERDLRAIRDNKSLDQAARDKATGEVMGNAAKSKELLQFKTQTEEMEKFWGKAMTSMDDALVEFVKTGKLNFSSLIDSMVSDLARMFIHEQITKPLFAGLFGSGGGGGGFFSGIASLFGFGGPRALGGPVSPGTSYWVGENGPERFTPTQPGYITPAGGGGQNITINIASPIVGNVANKGDVVAGMQVVKADIMKTIRESQRRGGNLVGA